MRTAFPNDTIRRRPRFRLPFQCMLRAPPERWPFFCNLAPKSHRIARSDRHQRRGEAVLRIRNRAISRNKASSFERNMPTDRQREQQCRFSCQITVSRPLDHSLIVHGEIRAPFSSIVTAKCSVPASTVIGNCISSNDDYSYTYRATLSYVPTPVSIFLRDRLSASDFAFINIVKMYLF